MDEYRSNYKKLLQDTLKCEFQDLNEKIKGNVQVLMESGNTLNCYIVPNNDQSYGSLYGKIYIFLSSVGIYRNNLTAYHRLSWAKYTGDVCIYLDDPTRAESKFAPAFYMGFDNRNIITEIVSLIA